MESTQAALRARLQELLSGRDEILEAYLFGSRARGQARATSDVDVAVFVAPERCPPSDWGYRAHLTADLMSGLGTNAVDVVLLNDAPPVLYHRVLRDGMRLYARDLKATTTREGRAMSRYFDYLPQIAKRDAARARRPVS